MEKNSIRLIVLSMLLPLVFSCNTLKKAKNNISASDVKNISDLINMDFGDGPNGPFDVSTTTTKKPLLIIQNDTDRTITVKAKGPSAKSFTISTKKSDSASIESGKYHFVATAPGTKGCEGDVELGSFKQYKWIFYIKN